MKRKNIIYIHLTLATYFLPITFFFMITGGLYTFGIKGQTTIETYEFESSQIKDNNISNIILQKLKHRNLNLNRSPIINYSGDAVTYMWKNRHYEIILTRNYRTNLDNLRYKEYNTLSWLMKLHKANGNTLFKTITAIWLISLLLIFLSGTFLAYKTSNLKYIATWGLILGTLTTIIIIFTN